MNKRKAIAIKKSVIEKMYGEGKRTKEETRQLLQDKRVKKICRAAKKWASKGRTNQPILTPSKRQKRLLSKEHKLSEEASSRYFAQLQNYSVTQKQKEDAPTLP
jgi:hypothetical protein